MKHKLLIMVLILLISIKGVEAQNENQMNKSINRNASVKCSKSILIHASSEKVWSILANIDQWATWQSDISNSKLKGELQPNSIFVWKTGGAKIHSILHTVDTNKAIGWTGKTFGVYAIHNWNLTEIDGSTEVSVDESMEGFLTVLFKSPFNKNLAAGMQHWLELLKIESEK